MKKFLKSPGSYPLIIVLLIFILDAINQYLILVALLPITIAYFISFVRNTLEIIYLLRGIKKQTKWQQFFISAYTISFTLNILLLVTFWFSWNTQEAFIMSAIMLSIFGWLSMKEEISENTMVKVEIKSVLGGICLPIIITASIVGVMYIMESRAYNRSAKEITQVLETSLYNFGIKGELDLVSHSSGAIWVEADYVITQSGVRIYAKARLERRDSRSDWRLAQSTLTDYKNSIDTLLQVPARSEEGQELLEIFRQEIGRSIEINQLTKELQVFTPEMLGIWQSPNFSLVSDGRQLSVELLAQIEQNVNSNNPQVAAFGGYTALTIQQLMETRTIVATVPVRFTEEFIEESGSGFSALSEKFFEQHYENIMNEIDFSNLPDGYYIVRIRGRGRSLMMDVKNHEIMEIKELIGHRPLQMYPGDFGSLIFAPEISDYEME